VKVLRLRLPEDIPQQPWDDIVNSIVQHCPKLEKIYFGRNMPPVVDHTRYRNLLVHYGTQLTRVSYGHLSMADLLLFINICPNNRCSWPQASNQDIQRFKVLRPVFRKISFDFAVVPDNNEFGILSECLILEHLEIWRPSTYGIKRLFGRSIITRLKVLKLIGCVRARQVAEIVVNHTPELETLDVVTTDMFPSPDVFQPIADSLRCIEYVRICEYDNDIRANINFAVPCLRYISLTEGIINTFSNASNLRLFAVGTRSVGCSRKLFKRMFYNLMRRKVHCMLEMPTATALQSPVYRHI